MKKLLAFSITLTLSLPALHVAGGYPLSVHSKSTASGRGGLLTLFNEQEKSQ